MPKVTIIVPVYKAEAYLPDCIDSILGQTFSDLEVFLVDDGSPDRCGEICEEYAARDSRIRVIHQKNSGQAAARNRALEQSSGEWVCFVDSDDLIHPQMVQRLYDAAMDNGSEVSMCMMLESPELPASFFAEPSGECRIFDIHEETLVTLHDREEYPAWVACAKLIRKDLVMKHLFCEGRVYEDNEAVCHWVCASEKLVRLKDAMYYYRTNPDSTTQRKFSPKKLDYLWALEQLIRFYDSLGYQQMKSRFVHRYAWELANCWEGAYYNLKDPKLAGKIRKQGKVFSRQQALEFTLEEREYMLQAMHPKLVRVYWPAKGVARTLRRDGIAGLIRKLSRRETS